MVDTFALAKFPGQVLGKIKTYIFAKIGIKNGIVICKKTANE